MADLNSLTKEQLIERGGLLYELINLQSDHGALFLTRIEENKLIATKF